MSGQSGLLSPPASRKKPRSPPLTPAQMKMHVEICESYSLHKAAFDGKAAAHKVHGIKGLRIAFNEAKKPELAYDTTRRYWTTNKWTLPMDEWQKAGGQPTLDPDQEEVLIHFCLQLAGVGFPIRVSELKLRVRKIAEKNGTLKKDGSKLDGWFKGFMERANSIIPSLSVQAALGTEGLQTAEVYDKGGRPAAVIVSRKKGQGLSTAREKSLNPATIKDFSVNIIGKILSAEPGLKIHNIANFDEFQFNQLDSLAKGTVIGPPGYMYQRVPTERDSHVTVLSGIIGGWATPTVMIFKGTSPDPNWMADWAEQTKDQPELDGMLFCAVSENGWITPEIKIAWMKKVLSHPNCPKGRHLFLADGHYTNLLLELWELMMNCSVAVTETAEPPVLIGTSSSSSSSSSNSSSSSSSSAASFLATLEQLGHGWLAQILAIFPAHCTHGLQQMDILLIARVKQNLGVLLERMWNHGGGKVALTTAQLVCALGVATYGGKISDVFEGETTEEMEGGLSSRMCFSAHKRAGWTWDEATGGHLNYNVLNVIEQWKLLPATANVGPDVGPALPQFSHEHVTTRRPTYALGAMRKPYKGGVSPAAALAAQCVKARVAQPLPQSEQPKVKRRKRKPGRTTNGLLCGIDQLIEDRTKEAAEAAAVATKAAKGKAKNNSLLADAIIDAARIVDNGKYNFKIAGIKEFKAVLRAHGQMKGNSQVSSKDALRDLVVGLVQDKVIAAPTAEVMAASDKMDEEADEEDEDENECVDDEDEEEEDEEDDDEESEEEDEDDEEEDDDESSEAEQNKRQRRRGTEVAYVYLRNHY